MTVQDLIDALQRLDPEHEVYIFPSNCGYDGDTVECSSLREVFVEVTRSGDIYHRDDKAVAKGLYPHAVRAIFIE